MGAASLHLFRAVRTLPVAAIVVWAVLAAVLLLALVVVLGGSGSDPSSSHGLFAPFRWNPWDPEPIA
jgi:uncharacterized membrane protein YdfJ with MMPL/SSD domain